MPPLYLKRRYNVPAHAGADMVTCRAPTKPKTPKGRKAPKPRKTDATTKPRLWKLAPADRLVQHSYEDLAKIERETSRRKPATTCKLLIKDIAIAPMHNRSL